MTQAQVTTTVTNNTTIEFSEAPARRKFKNNIYKIVVFELLTLIVYFVKRRYIMSVLNKLLNMLDELEENPELANEALLATKVSA